MKRTSTDPEHLARVEAHRERIRRRGYHDCEEFTQQIGGAQVKFHPTEHAQGYFVWRWRVSGGAWRGPFFEKRTAVAAARRHLGKQLVKRQSA